MPTIIEKAMKKQLGDMPKEMQKKMSKKEKVKAIMKKNKRMKY